MVLAAKRRLGQVRKGQERVRKGLGPAEGAMAAYFASRKQIRLWLLHSALCFQHCLRPQGAGRIPCAMRIPPGQTPNMYFLENILFRKGFKPYGHVHRLS